VLEHDGTIEVVGVHGTAESAIAALPSVRPDLLTMDVELPGMSGFEAVEQIMSSQPVPILVLSSHVRRGGELAAAALAAGALEAVGKDDLDLTRPGGAAAAAFRGRIRVLARARVIRHPRAKLRRGRSKSTAPSRKRGAVEAIGIVASTGGPQALAELLAQLPAAFAPPLLVVQHMAAGFTAGLATWLDATVPVRVQLAAEGAPLGPGAWVAPEGAHLVLGEDRRLTLDRRTPGMHRPSGDVLFRNLAERLGAHAVGVVLSGMGSDGAQGVAALSAAGGLTIAQDEESSAIYGMPKAAADAGAELVLPLPEIAPALLALAGAKR
jgi:two-component system chemotaxis response regulator CheB